MLATNCVCCVLAGLGTKLQQSAISGLADAGQTLFNAVSLHQIALLFDNC